MSAVIDLTFVTDPEQSTGTVLALGDGSPQVSYGDLGWEEVARPKQPAFLNWVGRPLIRQQIPLLFDRIYSKQSVQREIDTLLSVCRPTDGPPALVRLHGPVHHTELLWAVLSYELADDSHRSAGAIVQQAATLSLCEHNEADIVVIKRKPKTRTYKVKKGDRISKIAQKKLGNAKRWPEIVELNKKKIKNPKKLKVGITLTLPAK